MRIIIYFAVYAEYQMLACSGCNSTSKYFLDICYLNIWYNWWIALLGQTSVLSNSWDANSLCESAKEDDVFHETRGSGSRSFQ